MTDVWDFDECLEKGELGESKVKELFISFYEPIAKRFLIYKGYKYGVSLFETKKQLSGQDGKLDVHFSYDVKLNRYYENKIVLLELFHMVLNFPKVFLGWFLTSKADVIFWLYRARKDKLYLFDSGYYLFLNNIRKWLIGNKNISEHFLIKKNNQSSIDNKGVQWDTYNMYLEIKDLPEDCILKIEKNVFVKPIEESYFYKFFNKEG